MGSTEVMMFFIMIYSGIISVTASNPITNILALMFCYIFSVMLFISMGFEFIGIFMLILYISAILIFMLFLIMSMHTRIISTADERVSYFYFVSFYLLGLMCVFYMIDMPSLYFAYSFYGLMPRPDTFDWTLFFGIASVLFSEPIWFLLMMFFLLFALSGPIVLLGKKPKVRVTAYYYYLKLMEYFKGSK